jgi:hypothetical protein
MFYNKDMSLTFYSFSCGYIETMEKDNIQLKLYYDNIFHIKGFNTKDHYGLFWYTEDNLTSARKCFYKQIKDFFNLSKQKYLKEVTIKENRTIKH